MRKSILLFLTLTCLISAQVYLDSTATIEQRVEDLIGRMTLDEKIGQMTQADHKAVSNMNDVKNYFMGSILSGGGSDPSSGNDALSWTNLYDSFQQKALETRLSIPLIYGVDAVHGHSNVTGATIFPHNIGLGATRNPDLIKEANRVTAIEIAATGVDWNFAPCVAVPRDERWGRTYEGYGETPELAVMFGGPAVEGLQGDSLNHPASIVACAKHYVGDGGTTGGDDQGNTELTEAELRTIHLPGYIDAIEKDVKTIMASYSSWNGVKLHGHDYLLNTVLKGELGFDGFIISDWAAIDQLPGDYTSDVKASINAGIDMVMVPNNYQQFFNTLKSLVQQNEVPVSRIDDAVKRILRVKFEQGLFERPLADRSLLSYVGSEEHRAVARQCVRESAVILKKNDNVLPLPKTGVKIFVAGEHADNIGLQCGGWTIQWQGQSGDITEGTTILEGLNKLAPDNEIVYSREGNFDANDADYIIVAIGEPPYAEGDGDKNDLKINTQQRKLVRKLKEMGKPVITILLSGRPMITNSELHNSDVFISAWLPGTEGDGIAEVLFGDYQPKGLLPFTWQKANEDIPQNFGDDGYDPLFEYGYGITNFDNSAAGSAPFMGSAMLVGDGSGIELAFNKAMEVNGSTNADFTINANGNPVTVTSITLSEHSVNTLKLNLSEALTKQDVIDISYNSGNLASQDGGTAATFSNVSVINFLTVVSPFHAVPGKVEAEDYSAMLGVQLEETQDVGGGLNVGWIDDNDWMEYNCEFSVTGTYAVRFRVASESVGGTIKMFADGVEKCEVNVPVTNGWQNWKSVGAFADLEAGRSTIRVFAQKGGFNLNFILFEVFTDVKQNADIPQTFGLAQNFPNPFNPSTNISFNLTEAEHVTLNIYNMLGEKVSEIINEVKNAGSYSVSFNASGLSSGMYFYELVAGNKRDIKKMCLLK